MSGTENPVARIADMLRDAGIPAMLTGSFAATIHGRPRATQDVDFVIETDHSRLRAFVRSLPSEYYVDEMAALQALSDESQFNIIDRNTGWKADLMIRKDRAFSIEEFRRRQRRRLGGIEVDVVTAEDLVLAKLEWARLGESERQLDDVAGIVGVRGDELDRDYIERWVMRLGISAEWQSVLRRVSARP